MTHIYPRATILTAIVKASADHPTACPQTIAEKVSESTGAHIDLVRTVLDEAREQCKVITS
jgi:hypothetical protein